MTSTAPIRNKYRGLQGYIRENYNIHSSSIEGLHAALQEVPKFKGVSCDSVSTAFYSLTRPASVPQGKTNGHTTPNFLITVPLAKRKSLTLSYPEALKLYQDLELLFSGKKP